jgi:hypothetical protein
MLTVLPLRVKLMGELLKSTDVTVLAPFIFTFTLTVVPPTR